MPKRMVIFDGHAKAVNVMGAADLDESQGWRALGVTSGPDALYFRRVPWLRRAIRARANAVAHVPFALVNKSGEDVTSSDSWIDPTGILPSPRRWIRKTMESYIMAGATYGLKLNNPFGYTKGLQYFNPLTITPRFDANGLLTGYARQVGARITEYAPELIFAFTDDDYLTEAGPSGNSDAKAALAAAGVLFNIDQFVASFFARGAIKATILVADTSSEDEARRLKYWWNDVITGVRNAWSAFVFRKGQINPVVVGEGLDSLRDAELTAQKRQDIATAIGVPESKLWSAAANFATSEQDNLAFYNETVIPDAEALAEAMTEQLYAMHGYAVQFRPEELSIYQADEADRAGALASMRSAGFPLVMACDKLGYKLSDEERAQLQALDAEPEPAPVATPAQTDEPDDDTEPEDSDRQAMRSALFNWKRASLAALKSGHSAAVDFDHPALPERVATFLRYELDAANTPQAVHALFKSARAMLPAPASPRPTLNLAEELQETNRLLAQLAGKALA